MTPVPATPVWTGAQSLTTLLTTESLLFTAFSAGVVLAAPQTSPLKLSRTGAYRVAKACVGVLALVATAAALAWWQVFGDHWPPSAMRGIEGAGIAIGIIAQPIVAGIVVWSRRP